MKRIDEVNNICFKYSRSNPFPSKIEKMKITIPIDVLRKIIADVLIERGNKILDDADRIAEQQIKDVGVVSGDFVGELETTSGGVYYLSDDVLSGYIPLEEELEEILSSFERDLVMQRCMEWVKKH